MSGILDAKTRIIDAVITDEGKRQISTGKLRIQFSAFTDRSAFYEASAASGSTDATKRLYFEAGSTLADQVTFETDDSGKLFNWTGGDLQLIDGMLIDASGAFVTDEFNTSQSFGFASLSQRLISSSTTNFKQLQFIGTDDPFYGNEFEISTKAIQFQKTPESPISRGDLTAISLDAIRPLFFDQRLAHSGRFDYMEPILPISGSDENGNLSMEPLAILSPDPVAAMMGIDDAPGLGYAKLNARDGMTTLEGLLRHLKPADYVGGSGLNKPVHEINFEKTSRDNNLVMQMFEIKSSELNKLDVIDYGEFLDDSGIRYRIFFVGKIFLDEVRLPSYVNIFTLVLTNEET